MTVSPTPEFLALDAAVAGRYLLERELGRGGMGVVFLARDVALERPVAIKLLPPTLAGLPELRAGFLQEARTAARLAHPHIVPIHAVEQRGELVFFVMAYIPGVTLAERVRAEGPLPPGAVARLVQEVAWALAHAHQEGVVHRDIKPENILLERGTGRALVTDFGIARLLESTPVPPAGAGHVMGTARFASPEQAAGEPVDGRSDLYSLGVTAFYALTGRYPFDAVDSRALLAQHLTLPAPPVVTLRAGVPPTLARAIDRCLAKSPDARFQTAGELAEAVALVGDTGATPAALQRIAREISAFGVDLVGYGSLAGVAIITQILSRHDLFGMGYVYTFAIALVLLSLTALRGLSLWRMVREAAAEGWDERDLVMAMGREARDAEARGTRPRAGMAASAAIFLAGFAALVVYWLWPKEFGQTLEGPIAWLLEVVGLIAPVALGRWFGARLEQPSNGRPGLFSRLVTRVKAGFLFAVARLSLRSRARPTPATEQPTEVLLAGAARDAWRALPDPERRRLTGVEALLARLEADAAGERRRLEELDRVAAQVGGSASVRHDDLARDLVAARSQATSRLEAAVSAMENLRLELLRVRAGLATAEGLTGDLEALRDLGARVDAEMELRSDGLG